MAKQYVLQVTGLWGSASISADEFARDILCAHFIGLRVATDQPGAFGNADAVSITYEDGTRKTYTPIHPNA
jgi:hypothetical protein